MFFHQAVVRLRAPVVRDRHGNRARDWSNATRATLAGVSVQPEGRAEQADPGARDRVTSGWRLQSAPGHDLDLEPTDRVELESGEVCEVVGEVARHPDPFGQRVHHAEAVLQRTTG